MGNKDRSTVYKESHHGTKLNHSARFAIIENSLIEFQVLDANSWPESPGFLKTANKTRLKAFARMIFFSPERIPFILLVSWFCFNIESHEYHFFVVYACIMLYADILSRKIFFRNPNKKFKSAKLVSNKPELNRKVLL